MPGWLEFWNAPQHLYVNPAHAARLYRELAEELARAAGIGAGDRCLDFGCGEALGTEALLERGATVLLYDGAPRMRALAGARHAGRAGVSLLDPAGFEALAPASLDVVAVISVVQYLPRADLAALLDRWRGLLRAGGRLVLGDIIPPDLGRRSDALALLRYCQRHGQLLPALRSLLATARSDYRRVQRAVGLSTYAAAEIVRLLGAHGFEVTRHERNLGVNPARMTFVCRLRPDPLEARSDAAR